MIAYVAVLLFLIGTFCCFKAGVKFGGIFSWLALISAFFVFILFFSGMQANTEDVFSFVWNSSPGGDMKIDIISNRYNYELVYPFFVITLLSLAGSKFLRLEKIGNIHSAVLIFNLVAIILMLTSNNFIQLLMTLFIIDILAFFIIKNAFVSRQYILMNIVADMMLFMVIAVINSRIKSLDIRQILHYNHIGFHTDFVAICGLTAIFIKFGFFVFHIGLCALKDIKLHNLINILFLFAPLSAMLVLLKFHVVWQNSPYFMPYLNLVCITTMCWSFWRCLSVDTYKAKIIYLQTMFWALLVELIRFSGFVWNAYFTSLIIVSYILTMSLYLFYYYSGRRNNMLQILNTSRYCKKGIISSCFLVLISVVLLSDVLYKIYNNSNRYYIWIFAVFYIISLSAIISQVCKYHDILRPSNFPIKFKWVVFIGFLYILSVPLRQVELTAVPVYAPSFVFLFCCLLPFGFCKKLYQVEWLQNLNGFNTLYTTLIYSAQLLGRFFLLLIDRVFIEKIVIRNSIVMTQSSLRTFRRLSGNAKSVLFILTLLLVLLWLSFKQGSGK